MTQALNLTLVALRDHLTKAMQTDIETDDLTYADVVKIGLLQTDKTGKNVQFGITGGDHEDPELHDAIVSLQRLPDVGFIVPAREVGGGQMWWRRGVVKMEAFFTRERLTEEEATEAGYELMGRLTSEIEQAPVAGITDSYGETVLKIFCYANTLFEAGGPPKSFIFRGKALWAVLTERP